jgi:hypothetical protein
VTPLIARLLTTAYIRHASKQTLTNTDLWRLCREGEVAGDFPRELHQPTFDLPIAVLLVDEKRFQENNAQLLEKILRMEHSSCVTTNSEVFATEEGIARCSFPGPAIADMWRHMILPYIKTNQETPSSHRIPLLVR